MDILALVRADIKGKKGRIHEVCAATGIPFGTLRKIVEGNTPNPQYHTVEKLRTYYAAEMRRMAA